MSKILVEVNITVHVEHSIAYSKRINDSLLRFALAAFAQLWLLDDVKGVV